MHDSKDGGGRATQEAKAEEQLPSWDLDDVQEVQIPREQGQRKR